jgi:hypothetical protein
MKNWFSSPDLCHKLYSEQTDAMGTLHQKRKGGGTCVSLQKQINDNEVEE